MINIDITKDIGQQIRTIRVNLGLKLKDVAKNINTSSTLLSYYENNKRVQNISILKKLLNFYNEL